MDQNNDEKLQRQNLEMQLRQFVSNLLTKEAKTRLANIRTVKPELASRLEFQLFQLAQTGAIRGQITDGELRNILQKVTQKRDTKIKFR